MTEFASLPKESQDHWLQRNADMKIDYSTRNQPLWRTVHMETLDEFTRAFQTGPLPAAARASIVEGRSLESLSSDELRRAVQDHVFGTAPIHDPAMRDGISRRMAPFAVDVRTARDITVTAWNPLIINESSVTTNYGTVTIRDGGYIRITVPCSFSALVLIKGPGSGTSPSDFIITGDNGTAGGAGENGSAGIGGNNGSGATANCGGDHVQATAGQAGQNGSDGNRGGNGTNGADGPMVNITIYDLRSPITVLNSGGAGGPGGAGGRGGNGGNGGDGGGGADCNSHHVNGANGGNGGNGANGGDGGNGGNGGNGGTVRVRYRSSNQSTVIGNGIAAAGGTGGTGGPIGNGGAGGAAGRAAVPGAPGNPGSKQGATGVHGNAGMKVDPDIGPL